MKVLITGGAGYIGTELTTKLCGDKRVSEIIVFDDLSRKNYNLFLGSSNLHSKTRFVNGSILDSRKLREILKNVDVVYHLAAKVTTPFADQNAHQFEQVNHWGTAELVYAVEESKVSKFIYLSSISVYGSGTEVVDADTIPNPKTYYGISKQRGEEHVNRLMNKMQTYILRCSNTYGYNRSLRFSSVINKFIFQANFDQYVTINGDGSQMRTFVHIERVAECLAGLLENKVPGGVYNLAEKNLTVLNIVEQLSRIYPEMEMIFLNQHIKMKEINVMKDQRLAPILSESSVSFIDELKTFRKHFSF